jgi:hypothetical protein
LVRSSGRDDNVTHRPINDRPIAAALYRAVGKREAHDRILPSALLTRI